ncbi:DMT family transporter [Amaricoccus tamworthensis]|uniref:DMT family transporter n=1 Tax=Amaricoccus tamworthensis TaxID=57002 RepID=UPI003C7B0360
MLGIIMMLGFCAVVPLSDAIAKLLGGTVSLVLLILARFVVQAGLLAPVVWWAGSSMTMTRRVFWLLSLRSFLHCTAMFAMFSALQYMPLADTVAIAFVMPFIMLLLSWWFLNEEIGPRRIAACGVGFIGTLLVVQPSFAEVGAVALLPLVVALGFALFMLVTRLISQEVDPMTMQVFGGVQVTVVLLPLMLIGNSLGWDGFSMNIPTARDGMLILVAGVLGSAAHLFMTMSLRYAPAATVAPMQYLEIPFATLVGWMVFGDLPNGLAALGIAITIGAGLYVIYREQVAGRRARAAARAAAGRV